MRRRKVLLAAGVTVAVLLLLCLSWALICGRDEAPFDDSDLRLERLDIPEKENAFYHFEQMAETAFSLTRADGDKTGQIRGGKLWDEAFVVGLL